VDLRAGVNDLEKKKFLTPPGLELQPVASRYPDSSYNPGTFHNLYSRGTATGRCNACSFPLVSTVLAGERRDRSMPRPCFLAPVTVSNYTLMQLRER
jgi:hypothetical protein